MPRQDMIRARRGTAAEWALSTDILYSGELAWASDTNEFKLGDGFNTFSALPSVSASDAAVAAFVTGGGPTETALNSTFVAVEGSPADGDAIIWDDVAGQWVPAAVEGGGTALTVLSEAEGNTGTETTARAISAARLVQQIAQHAAAGPAGAPGADGADGAPGADGASAYDVAVAEGFVGDETAWLASLVGADGADSTVPGPQGPAGADGADGSTGAQGPQGIQGETGPQGIQGVKGDTGDTGPTGPAGADGSDGAPGADGADGAPGAPGADGADGTDGADADPTALLTLERLSAGILGIPSMGTADTRFSIPPAVKPKDWFGDDPSSVYFQRYAFLAPWQLKRIDAWFNNIGTAGGVRVGLYNSADGRPSGDPVLEMTKTYTDLAPPAAGGSNQRTFNFGDTVWREPGVWFLAYTHWGSGMSVLNMESELAGPRIRLSIGEIAPSAIVGSDWWQCGQSAGNTLPHPVNSSALTSALAVPWMSLGFSAP